MAGSTRYPLVSYQPLRLFFKLSYYASIIPRLPYYALISLVPFLRPNRTWTAKQTFTTRLFKPMLHLMSSVGITQTLTLEKGADGDRFQTVQPSALDVYKGPLASETVKPAPIGGTWFPRKPTEAELKGKVVALYFHGGAFVEGDGRSLSCGPLAKRLLEKGGADAVFSVQYRLASYGSVNPFPAALQDAVSSYLFLLNDLHVPASQIVVGGDSAGGNLTLAFLRYLHEFGDKIGVPNPKCALLLSPWVAPFKYDMTGILQGKTDFLPSSFPRWGAIAYGGGREGAAEDPYITPLGNPFPTKVPMFASAASAEFLYEDIKKWAAETQGVSGNVVELHHEMDAVHDTFLCAELFGFEDSAWEVAAKVGEFVRKH
ncbi:alpha/beta hydrolase fold-3 domain-containing protein [Nemania sp. FL0031]|nr:alpha/beta hydrolase fold-3 domain-containing protein [Nemania sp. FL0031]